MKFSIGDKVILKHSGEEGVVIAVINKLMVEVDVTGVTFPVYIDDIDHPYLKWFTDKTTKKEQQKPNPVLPPEKPAERKQRLAKGVYLSFMPVFKTADMEDVVEYLKVYLLNEMPQDILFTYDNRVGQKSSFLLEGVLHAFGNIYLHNVPYETMNDQPRFTWKIMDMVGKNSEVEEGVLRIRPAKLFEHINTLLVKSEPSFAYLLIDGFKPKKKELPKPKFEPIMKPEYVKHKTTINLEPAKQVIDLHIEQLVESTNGMTNTDIIMVQLDTLRRYLSLAIAHHQEMMVVIHGLGKGTLKEEVHKILKQTEEVARYKNEWSGKYGFGATEVWFRYH